MKRQNLINSRGSSTQKSVAEIIGISQKHLSAIELGRRLPSLDVALALSKLYKKSVDDLFTEKIYGSENFN